MAPPQISRDVLAREDRLGDVIEHHGVELYQLARSFRFQLLGNWLLAVGAGCWFEQTESRETDAISRSPDRSPQ
jgi:hypothetical protein